MTRKSLFAVFGAAAIASGAAFVPHHSAQAQSIACGEAYTIKTGDTLSLIARRAYGSVGDYTTIFNANRAKIGANPSLIEIGTTLQIPCLDGASSKPSTADASKIREEKTAKALPPPEDRTIRILTGTDWAPYLNEDHKQGGMLLEVVNVAMKRANGKPKYKIDFINDWGAHLQPLLSDHAYDLGVAWFRPNCSFIDKLGDDSKFRCNNLDWSEPVFEEVVGYYTRADEAAPAEHSDLFGRTVCRPAGYAIFMLEEKDLVEPNIKFVRPGGPEEAFKMLMEGGCDAVMLSVDVAEDAIAKLGAADKFRLNEPLNYIAAISIVISKTHPRGEEILAAFNDGLKKIKEDGTWFSIIQRHLAEHKAKTASN